jgi:hypothetical protein
MRKTILASVIVATCFTVSGNTSAYCKEPLRTYSTGMQYTLLEQVLFTELHPKIMSVLREKYHTDFLFDNAHVLPIRNLDFPDLEFTIEGRVVTRGTNSETVHVTFIADGTNGYKVHAFDVIRKEYIN